MLRIPSCSGSLDPSVDPPSAFPEHSLMALGDIDDSTLVAVMLGQHELVVH